MSKVLILSGHPDLDASLANRIILSDLADERGIAPEIRRLDRLYPDYRIDVAAEQTALVAADVIVWQFPFYWYALPALFKKWVDDVLVFGFAHGVGGDKLHGKTLVLSFTTGAPEAAYAHGQPMNHTVEEFLPPLRQTAALCGLKLADPVHSHGMMFIPGVTSDAQRAEVEARAHNHAARLIATLQPLI
ncbi:flavodoxin family protein [Novosphingobium umbonatum]|uniref:Flavodoxin family protein n=1 Tax=Novosphingobium umbonatum TaxID=1908524 RepID=A0A3S2UVX3_9SPHN|nr:NAD(P)H-dependent oxidoreductase [Novosphingobium umbonatum]RVU06453.1 flavodoxin family protein [Novosphingobium umbonatum]